MYIKTYLILSHEHNNQLYDLMDKLNDGKCEFFVHLDKNAKFYKKIDKTRTTNNLNWVKLRYRSFWGSFNLVEATIEGLKEIRQSMALKYPGHNYHVILLSAEDLPIYYNEMLHKELSSNPETIYMNYWELPYENWFDGGMFRFKKIYFCNYKKYKNIILIFNNIIKKIGLLGLTPLNRLNKLYPNFKLYGGMQWMILSSKSIEFLLEFVNKNKKLYGIFRWTLAPDELFIQSVLCNNDEIQRSIINKPTHFVKFCDKAPSPNYLLENELKKNVLKKYWFARKFNLGINPKAIERMNKIRIHG